MDKTKNCLYICLYIYIWYMRILYIHSALFVRDAIFLHVIDMSKASYVCKAKKKSCMYDSLMGSK